MARVGRTYLDTRTEECSYVDHDLSANETLAQARYRCRPTQQPALILSSESRTKIARLSANFTNRFSTLVFTLAMRMLKARSDAEDLLRRFLFKFGGKPGATARSEGSPEAWIINIARSRAIDKMRSIRRMGRSFVLTDDPARAQLGENIGSWTAESEGRMAMNRALANLPETQRKVLELAYLDGMTQTEIAERLAEPLGTIKTRMRAGIERLREIVSSQVA